MTEAKPTNEMSFAERLRSAIEAFKGTPTKSTEEAELSPEDELDSLYKRHQEAVAILRRAFEEALAVQKIMESCRDKLSDQIADWQKRSEASKENGYPEMCTVANKQIELFTPPLGEAQTNLDEQNILVENLQTELTEAESEMHKLDIQKRLFSMRTDTAEARIMLKELKHRIASACGDALSTAVENKMNEPGDSFPMTPDKTATNTEILVARKDRRAPIKLDESMTLWRMIDKSDSPLLDFVWTHIDGLHGRRVNTRSTKLYYVASGELTIRTDAKTILLSSGDVCVVPPGVWCEITAANAEVGIACTPAFDPLDEQVA